MGALLALLAAVSYGAGDFVGGVGGRRTVPALVTVVIQVVGVLSAALAVLVVPGGAPTAAVLAWGALSGVGSGIGNAALFRGLALGRMSVVAPVSAVTTALLPALAGVLDGDRLSGLAWAGVAVALPAIALVSREPGGADAGEPLRDVRYGLLAGTGFGLLFIALDRAGTAAGAWPLLPGQLVAVAVVAALAGPAMRRADRAGWGPAVRWGLPSGLLGAAANLLFLAATGRGQLTVAAVLTALYPAVTVLLAATVLRERLRAVQAVGLAAAGVAVTLVVLG
ncbi:EamA family transporter [Spirilliplanes yamanashiensis]|uniref:EamA family transporter n=1 Tax=Spirilliplanes yamanashiensis TaxID=42233 RepID=UPI00195086EB|nr:EamA family transporter [Spirilliplanes yamanashiensis]MDP9819022.1 drug/metabolite transporter (DMT)-like permease [Spirilliplanes yamanashiensis]